RADVDAIAAMSRDLIEDGLQWAWTPRRVAASVRRRDALVVVARANTGADAGIVARPVARARIVGFAIMRYGNDDAHLDLLAVDPDHRRHGLGRRLVEWLEKPALVAGIRSIVLEVRESNGGARAFYTRLGYRQRDRLAGYYQDLESAIRMGRELGAPLAPLPP